ncbi:hypothetical protein V7024_08575 [Bacillus sp. JJ864]|uniref:hypothetical protein n=1 Tax=Bacillus sp. JJ864 TaxID=3122975 RepID=UPI002FFF1A02
MTSINMVALKEYAIKTAARLNQIEKVIINENNSKRRNVRKSCERTTKRSQIREKHLFGSRNRVRSRKPKN